MNNLMKTRIALLLILFTTVLASCTKDFKELNTSPNNLPAVLPETLLAPALYSVVIKNINRSDAINNELMQVTVTSAKTDGDVHRYDISPNLSDYMWNGWYLELTNFRDMYKSASKVNNKTYMGIALICDAWVTSLLTDTYGDIPYFDANKGKESVFLPKFDPQQEIYMDIFRKLEEANILLQADQQLTSEQQSLELLYNGVPGNWRRFGNSLYLRLLMRVSSKPESGAVQKINEILQTNTAKYPIFVSNAQSAILKFTGVEPFVSAFQNWTDSDFEGNRYAEFFINNLVNWEDPRLSKWATRYEGTYAGVQSGFLITDPQPSKSKYLPALKTDPLLGNIINYSEILFIKAEAAAKNMIDPAGAKAFYELGVNNAITHWGLTVPVGHLTKPYIAWDNASSLEDQLELILTQKYYALFMTDFQQWFEYRRTGIPRLTAGPGAQNNGIMPSRITYPVITQSLNRNNYNEVVARIGGDNIHTKVWWNK